MKRDDDHQRLADQARRAREWRTSRGVESPVLRGDLPVDTPCPAVGSMVADYDAIEERVPARVHDMIDASQAHDMIADLVDALRVTLPACPHDEASAITYARGKAWLTTHRKAP